MSLKSCIRKHKGVNFEALMAAADVYTTGTEQERLQRAANEIIDHFRSERSDVISQASALAKKPTTNRTKKETQSGTETNETQQAETKQQEEKPKTLSGLTTQAKIDRLEAVEDRTPAQDELLDRYYKELDREKGLLTSSAEEYEAEAQALAEQRFEGLFSKTYPTDKSTTTTVQRIKDALRSWFVTDEMEANRIVVVQTPDELSSDVKTNVESSEDFAGWDRTQAFVLNGKGYMIADNIAEGSEMAVFMHEVGGHIGLDGKEAQIMERVNLWSTAAEGSLERRVYDAMQARMEAAGGVSDTEKVAYTIEEAVKAGVTPQAVKRGMKLADVKSVQDLVNYLASAFKAAVEQLFKTNKRGFTAQQLVDFAYGAARDAMKSSSVGSPSRTQFSVLAAATANQSASVFGIQNPASEGRLEGLRRRLDADAVKGAAREGGRRVGNVLSNAIDWLKTQRGAAMTHRTAGTIQNLISEMGRFKDYIMTDLNETLAAFNAGMNKKDVRKVVNDILAAQGARWDQIPSDVMQAVAKVAKEHLDGTRPMFEHDNITGAPRLAEHVRRLGVELTREEIEKGVRIAKTGEVISFPKDATKEQKDLYMKTYESAVEAMIVGHLHLLDAESKRAEVLFARDDKELQRKYKGDAYGALKALREKYRVAYERTSSLDVLSKRAVQDDEATAKKFESFEETVHGLLSGEANLNLVGDTGKVSAEVQNVLDLLGVTKEELDKLLAPLKSALDATPIAKRPSKIKELRDAVAAGIQPTQLRESEVLSAAQSILGQYVPFKRFGKYMMRAKLMDGNGNDVTGLVKYTDNDGKEAEMEVEVALGHWQSDDKTMLDDYQKEFNLNAFKSDPITVMTPNGEVQAYMVMDVPLQVDQYKKTISRIRPSEFLSYAKAIGVNLTPAQQKRVITATTNADAAVRSRALERRNIPGYDRNFQRAIADHLGSVASLAAIRSYEDKIQAILGDDQAWKWSEDNQKELDDAIAEAKGAKTDAERKTFTERVATLEFYKQGMKEAEFGGKLPEIRENSRRLVDFVLGGDQLEEKQTWLTKARAMITILQLGGTLASPFTNLSSIPLHAFSYLATYNKDRAFGGGFGGSAASSALGAAMKVMLPVLRKSAAQIDPRREVFFAEEYFRSKEKEALRTGKPVDGYSAKHWEFVRRATADGSLSAQKYNELLSQRKHSQFGPKTSKAISHYMAIFSATEEFNRAVTGMAAFDLYFKQYKEALGSGEENEKKAFDMAYAEAISAVYRTQGEYNMANRPRLFRSDVGAMLGMYKTFVITTLELIRNLPPKGRAIFLGSLFAMAGAGGIPFWEELMIVFDVISQKTGIGLGITKGNAEKAFTEFARDVGKVYGIENLDHAMMRGIFDTMFGTEVMGRAGVQVGIPGLGLLRAGAKFDEELKRTLGAFGGAADSAIKMVGKAAAGDVEGVVKNAPITLVKNLAGAYEYAYYGNALNKRGQVVTKDPDTVDILARALGFYPDEFMRVNEQVRREEYTRAYVKELKNQLVEKYRKAAIRGDIIEKQDILASVRDHNMQFRGTALELPDFKKNADRAADEAKKPLAERFKESLPTTQRATAMVD